MAEGRGVTNYSLDKPAFGFSTSTTEFDDELIRRGIVSFEQSMIAKGASPEVAQRLKQQRFGGKTDVVVVDSASSDEDDDLLDDDDDFLQQYRERRMQEMCRPRFGAVIPIARPEWTKQVNEESSCWVVVTLTSSDSERTGCVEAAVAALAPRYPWVKFVTIPYRAAIANWPEENLPSLFLYRGGTMQHQLVGLPRTTNADQLEQQLAQKNVLKESQASNDEDISDDEEEER